MPSLSLVRLVFGGVGRTTRPLVSSRSRVRASLVSAGLWKLVVGKTAVAREAIVRPTTLGDA